MNNLFETATDVETQLKKYDELENEDSDEAFPRFGKGCILAHCMGLGKTLCSIAFLHTVMNHDTLSHEYAGRTALVLCPKNVFNNWYDEVKKWMKKCDADTRLPCFQFPLGGANKDDAKIAELEHWRRRGGLMIMTYDQFKQHVIRATEHEIVLGEQENLDSKKKPKTAKTRSAKIKKKLRDRFNTCLLDPGPDIAVLDESHIIKNEKSIINATCNLLSTRRRICLTGTPMQNNLEEYYWMVNFCKPNLLGTYKEYKNLYSLPINAGQKKDANDLEVQRMREQSAVLFMTLNETVHRQDESILIKMLPKRQEYLIKLRLTPIQEKLYERYMNIRGLDEFMQQDDKQDTAMKDEDPDMMNALRGEMKAGLFSDKLKLETLCFHPGLLQIAQEYCDSDDESMGSFIDDEDDSDVKSISSVSSKKSTRSSIKTSDTHFLIQMSLDELAENAEKNYDKITKDKSFSKTFKPDTFAQIYKSQVDSEKISVVRRLAYTFHFMVSSVIEYNTVFREAVDHERIVVMPEQLEHAKAEKINKMVNLLKQHFRDQGKTNEQELLREISAPQVQSHIKTEVEKGMKNAKKLLQQANIKKVSDTGNQLVETRIKADASTKAKKEAAKWFQDGEIGFEYDEDDIDVSLSGKTALILKIIQASSEAGEKIVIATQRLDVLNQIELILKQETQRTREMRKKRRVKTVKIGSEDESEQLIAKTARENSGRW